MSDDTHATPKHAVEVLGDYSLTVTSPEMPPLYGLGQTVPFSIELTCKGKPLSEGNVSYRFLWDLHDPAGQGELELTGCVLEVPFRADKPGFVQLDVTFETGEGPLKKSCGAGFAVEDLKPSAEAPEDFNAFWEERKQQLAGVPVEARYEEITKESHPHLHDTSQAALLQADVSGVDLSYVTVTCLGTPVHGVLTLPRDRSPGRHPAILALHGAGVIPTQPHNFIGDAEKGAIVFEMNAHGIPDDQPKAFYEALTEGALRNYPLKPFGSRDDFYFLGMFLRVKRGLDFLKSLPEWNGNCLFIRGGSQGGAQSMAGAYLDPDVTGLIAGNPGFCDHTGALARRRPGWPMIVPFEKDKTPDRGKLDVLRYFDGVNFMRNTAAEAFFSVGYLDTVCSPAGVYTACNVHPGSHQMVDQPYMAHSRSEETMARLEELMWAHCENRI